MRFNDAVLCIEENKANDVPTRENVTSKNKKNRLELSSQEPVEATMCGKRIIEPSLTNHITSIHRMTKLLELVRTDSNGLHRIE